MRKIVMLLLVAVVALGAALFIEVRSHSNSSTPTTSSPTSTSTPNSSTTSTTQAVTPVCNVGNLSIFLTLGSAGAGHVTAPLVFKNISSSACSMRGYPGVDGANASHTLSLSALRATGAGISTVVLQPGASASALLVGVNVPSGTQASCGSFSVLYVTPPNTKTFVQLSSTLPDCPGFTVYPVVAGTSGI